MKQNLKQGRLDRKEKINVIIERLDACDSLVFGDYRGLSVLQMSEIRRALAMHNACMHVHKNRLIKCAISEKKYPKELVGYFVGPTAVTYIKGDVTPVLKLLFDFAKKEYSLKVRGAYMDETVFAAEDAQKLSKLPSKNELFSILMGTMNAPVQSLARACNDVIARLARTLQAVVDKK